MADDGDGLVWPRERSEQVGDYRHFRVRQDWNRAPDTGEVRDFYVLDIQDWVQVIAITPAGRLVMVRQFRPGTRRVTTEFVAGLIEPGESPAEAAVRELEEETGHCGGEPRVLGDVDPNAALQNNRLFIVLVEDCLRTGTRNEDPGEVIQPIEVDPDEVDAMIADGRFQEAYGIVAWDFYRRRKM